MTHEPSPSDLVNVYSVSIGSGGAQRFAEMLSHGVAEASSLLNRYLTLDKIIPPWLKPIPGRTELEREAEYLAGVDDYHF